MAGEKSPNHACGQLLFSLKMSKLNYLVKETQYFAYITIRKSFIKDNTENISIPVSEPIDKQVELLALKERNKDLETRLALAVVNF